jgi:hypothetical protein
MDDVVEKVARDTVRAWPDLAAGTRTGRPKAWGALAAKGVSALRAELGRPLSDAERRTLWEQLWRAATQEGPPS